MTVIFNQATPAELVEKHALELAQKIGAGNELTRSQLRRFYQEYLGLRENIRIGGDEAYKKNEVAIKMLIAKAAYALGRQQSGIPKDFVDWLSKNLREIKSKADVETFGSYFEAFLGYYYGEQKKAEGGRGR